MVGTSQKWPAKAGGRSPKGPAVAGTTVHREWCSKCASNMSFFSWMISYDILNIYSVLNFIVLPDHKNATGEMACPDATSKIVPNSMPSTPLPCMIAERFQICFRLHGFVKLIACC